MLLATARSKDHRDRLKARQASIKKGSLLPHPREPGLFVTIDQFIDISGLPKSTVTRRLKRIWPIENLPSEDVVLALTKRGDRRRIFEFTLDSETVRAGVNELATRFERPKGNSRSAIKKGSVVFLNLQAKPKFFRRLALCSGPANGCLYPSKLSRSEVYSLAIGRFPISPNTKNCCVKWILFAGCRLSCSLVGGRRSAQ